MRRLPGVRPLLRLTTSRRSIESDVDHEMAFHIQMRVEDLMRQGRLRVDAESEARREFGDVDAARTELSEIDRRTARRAGWRERMSSVAHDARISLRGLRARPAFTATVLLTLALAIGANAAIFSVTYAVLVKPLPFGQPERLVHLWETFDGPEKRSEASYPDYLDLRARTRTLNGIAGYQTRGALLGAEHPVTVRAGAVTANFFEVLGVRPSVGRAFIEGEDAVGAPHVVVVSAALWQRQFGRDRRVVGTKILLDGEPATVVGVLPDEFHFGGRASAPDLWVPIPSDVQRANRGAHWLNLVGRLRDGATVDQATRELSGVMQDLAIAYPRTNIKRAAYAIPLRDELVGSVRPLLLALYGAVVVVLLVACTNVANLMLMRGTDRAREMAVRVALGAGRGRLVRQLLIESLLLAVSGGVLAIVLAQLGIRAIVGAIPPRTIDSLPALATAGVDGRVVVYAALLSLVAGAAFGILPAFRATRVSIHDLLKQGAKGSSARGRLRDGLVIAEIALTVVLVSGATLFGRSLTKLLAIDIGFRTTNITTAGILMSSGVSGDPARSVQAFERVIASVRALPGVESVGLVSRLPMNAGESWDFEIAGRPRSLPGQAPSGSIRWVAGDYFATLGIALRHGRLFTDGDRAGAPLSVIVNEALVRQYFAGMNPLGQLILRGRDSLRVVGVVRDVPIGKLEDKVPPTWYVPMAQAPQGFMRIAIRADRSDPNVLRQLSGALESIDPNAAVVDPVTMSDLLTRSPSVFTRRFPLLLIGTFAVTALVLALVGIYGVVSYSVGQQRRELGIRLALGADARSVIALFLRRSAWMAALGAAVGIAAAVLAGRFISGMLYGVEASDPVTYTGTALLLSVAALAATLVPALRAARVDPTITLRAE